MTFFSGLAALSLCFIASWSFIGVKSQTDVCSLSLDSGPCKRSLSRFFYDSNTDACYRFVYGGCKGNGNNFGTLCECEHSCVQQARKKRSSNKLGNFASILGAGIGVDVGIQSEFPPSFTCGRQEITPDLPSCACRARITCGTSVVAGNWPWLVQIRLDDRYYCVGTLIHAQWVLTAAQCVQSTAYERWRFVVGRHARESCDEVNAVEMKAINITIHPNFSSTSLENDMALVQLERPVTLTRYVQPICAPDLNEIFNRSAVASGKCFIAGWGISFNKSSGRYEEVDVMHHACVPDVIDRAICDSLYVQQHARLGIDDRVLDKMICAGSLQGGPDTCNGDAGAPLMCEVNGEYIVAGLASWGYDCGEPALMGVYTEVSRSIDWVEGFTGPLRTRPAATEPPCLYGEDRVTTSEGDVKVKDVRVGDKVLTVGDRGDVMYEVVYQVSKAWPSTHAKYVKIQTASHLTIHLSPHHTLYTVKLGGVVLRQAVDVVVGDVVVTRDPRTNTLVQMEVVASEQVNIKGVFNIQTTGGSTLVNSVLVSTYGDMCEAWWSHQLKWPIRMAYTLYSSLGVREVPHWLIGVYGSFENSEAIKFLG